MTRPINLEAADFLYMAWGYVPAETRDKCKQLEEALRDAPSAAPEDGGITQALVQMARDNALEEAADLADQKLDVYSGTLCTYRGDVAEAIRGLKSEPQQESPK